jgi:hypothetical protein
VSASNIVRKIVSLQDLKHGDTVEINGELETVSKSFLKRCEFMCHTYKGDPFIGGITKVVFKVPTAHGYRYA